MTMRALGELGGVLGTAMQVALDIKLTDSPQEVRERFFRLLLQAKSDQPRDVRLRSEYLVRAVSRYEFEVDSLRDKDVVEFYEKVFQLHEEISAFAKDWRARFLATLELTAYHLMAQHEKLWPYRNCPLTGSELSRIYTEDWGFADQTTVKALDAAIRISRLPFSFVAEVPDEAMPDGLLGFVPWFKPPIICIRSSEICTDSDVEAARRFGNLFGSGTLEHEYRHHLLHTANWCQDFFESADVPVVDNVRDNVRLMLGTAQEEFLVQLPIAARDYFARFENYAFGDSGRSDPNLDLAQIVFGIHPVLAAHSTAGMNLQDYYKGKIAISPDSQVKLGGDSRTEILTQLRILRAAGDAMLASAVMGRWFFDHTLALLHIVPPHRWDSVPKLLRRTNPVEFARAIEVVYEIKSPRMNQETVRIMGNFSWLDNFRLSGVVRGDAATTIACNFALSQEQSTLSEMPREERAKVLAISSLIDKALRLPPDFPHTCRAQLEAEFEDADSFAKG
ncbi:MAG: hypothetical protein QY326_03360 [Bdellovibrionota bacterium]|nr:MAG: hypothetical protein QY326_03360 [Bdellovibrionota bacterium]